MGNCLCWYLVFNLVSYKFHQHLFCVLLFISRCMCVVLPLLVFLGGYIFISIVLLLVVSCLVMQVNFNHSLVQVNVNLPE